MDDDTDGDMIGNKKVVSNIKHSYFTQNRDIQCCWLIKYVSIRFVFVFKYFFFRFKKRLFVLNNWNFIIDFYSKERTMSYILHYTLFIKWSNTKWISIPQQFLFTIHALMPHYFLHRKPVVDRFRLQSVIFMSTKVNIGRLTQIV